MFFLASNVLDLSFRTLDTNSDIVEFGVDVEESDDSGVIDFSEFDDAILSPLDGQLIHSFKHPSNKYFFAIKSATIQLYKPPPELI